MQLSVFHNNILIFVILQLLISMLSVPPIYTGVPNISVYSFTIKLILENQNPFPMFKIITVSTSNIRP